MTANAFLVRWGNGWAERVDAASIAADGRFEELLGLGALGSLDEAYRVADGQLAEFARRRIETTIGIAPDSDATQPYLAYIVGDSPTVETVRHRVLGLTVTEDTDTGRGIVVPTLNDDIVLGHDQRVNQAIVKMIPGTIGGRSKVAQPVIPTYIPRGLVVPDSTTVQTEFDYTGACVDWVVPAGITLLLVDAYGSRGGQYDSHPSPGGGLGGRVQAFIAVTPGETLRVCVGGHPSGSTSLSAPGFNGGGEGGDPSLEGNGGGGATDIRRAPYGLADRLVVAAGGGGSTQKSFGFDTVQGGDGAYLLGGHGLASPGQGFPDATFGGAGATQSAGGSKGNAPGGGGGLHPATDGSFGQGGQGRGAIGDGGIGGGGGGGGWYGGGGGGEMGGGGGGSGYTTGTILTTEDGVRDGHGFLTIDYTSLA